MARDFVLQEQRWGSRGQSPGCISTGRRSVRFSCLAPAVRGKCEVLAEVGGLRENFHWASGVCSGVGRTPEALEMAVDVAMADEAEVLSPSEPVVADSSES